jgi:transcription antitermination factor NusG
VVRISQVNREPESWVQSPASSTEPKSWFAVQVKRAHETIVAEHLHTNGFSVVLPLYRAKKEWSDRTKDVDLPLFPGYVFCQFEPAEHLRVEILPSVTGIVSFGRKFAAIDPAEIAAIQSVLATGLKVAPWPKLEPGRKVQIHRGPLRGLIGVVVGDKSCHRLILSVTMLNRSISVEMDRGWFRSFD